MILLLDHPFERSQSTSSSSSYFARMTPLIGSLIREGVKYVFRSAVDRGTVRTTNWYRKLPFCMLLCSVEEEYG